MFASLTLKLVLNYVLRGLIAASLVGFVYYQLSIAWTEYKETLREVGRQECQEITRKATLAEQQRQEAAREEEAKKRGLEEKASDERVASLEAERDDLKGKIADANETIKKFCALPPSLVDGVNTPLTRKPRPALRKGLK